MKFIKALEVLQAINDGKLEEFASSVPFSERIEFIEYMDDVLNEKHASCDKSDIKSRYKVYMNILDMTLTQFIYLEHEIKHGMTQRLLSLIVRPIDEESFDDTTENEEAHINAISDEDATTMMGIIHEMKKNREYNLFTKFSGVIYVVHDETDEEEDEEPIQEDTFSSRWFWYAIVKRLANNDITKFSEIYSLMMGEVLVDLAYETQLNEMEENQRRAEEARNSARYR